MPVFRRYTDQENALKDLTLLRENNVAADLSQEHINGVLNYQLELNEVFMDKAEKLISSTSSSPEEAPAHFMEDYTDEELEEIIIHYSEYAESTVAWARNALEERNPAFDFTSLEHKQADEFQKRLKEVQRGIRAKPIGLIAAYLFALIGGLLGMATGWFIEVSQTKGVDGIRYPTYDAFSRRHAKRIKWIGFVVLIISVILKIFGPAL
jgi:hypothetical protein